jgi:putative hydrolase of the HAD superfamily
MALMKCQNLVFLNIIYFNTGHVMAIKNIVFDLGNVLVPFNYQIVIDRLNRVEAGLGDYYQKFYSENYHFHRDYERGQLTDDEFVAIMLGAVNHKIDAETYCHMFSEIFTVNEDVAALLPVLKRKYRVFLLSNTSAIHQRYGWARYSFLQHFEKLFLSHEVGAVKPEAKMYQAVMDFTGDAPETHIFIDDVAEYAQGARAMGWDAIQFTGYSDLEAALTVRGILPVSD